MEKLKELAAQVLALAPDERKQFNEMIGVTEVHPAGETGDGDGDNDDGITTIPEQGP